MSGFVLEGWVDTQLGQIVDYGKAAKKTLEDVEPETWILELEDIEKDSSKLLSKVNASERPFKSTKNVFKKGDVLYGKLRPYLNKVIIAGSDGVCTTEIIPIDSEPFCLNRYLFYWLKSSKFLHYVDEVSYGVNMPRLGTKDANAAPFRLAPLAEQKVIADKLDELLAQVESTKARLDAIPAILKSFRQSLLAVAVSGKLTEEWRNKNGNKFISESVLLEIHRAEWEKGKLKDFAEKEKLPKNDNWKQKYKPCEIIEQDKTWLTPTSWAWTTIDTIASVTKLAGFEFTKFVEYTSTGTIPVLKAENVGKEGFKITNFSKVPLKTVEQLPRSELFGNEILITFVGAGVGQVARVPTDQKYFLGPNVAVVRNNYFHYLPVFFELLLKSNEGKKNLLSFSKGAAQPSLSMEQIRKTTIPLPPIEEQTEIVRRVEELLAFADKVEAQVNAAQLRVNNLTQSILAKAFRGELTAEWRAANPELICGENSATALLERIKAEREALSVKKKPAKKAKA